MYVYIYIYIYILVLVGYIKVEQLGLDFRKMFDQTYNDVVAGETNSVSALVQSNNIECSV